MQMDYLTATYYFDYESQEIQQLIATLKSSLLSDKEKTIYLYLKVRDSWRYDPYTLLLFKREF